MQSSAYLKDVCETSKIDMHIYHIVVWLAQDRVDISSKVYNYQIRMLEIGFAQMNNHFFLP